MLERIGEFINDEEFSFTVYENRINIKNFKRIITLENDYISLICPSKKINIKGSNLTLKKLVDYEMLIVGNINLIEVLND